MIAGQVEQYFTTQRKSYAGQNLAVAVGAGATDLIEIPCSSIARVFCILQNSGGNALTAFNILADVAGPGTVAGSGYVTLYSGGYAVPTGILLGTSGDIAVLAAAAFGWFIINCIGLNRIKLQATRAAATTLNVWVQGGSE